MSEERTYSELAEAAGVDAVELANMLWKLATDEEQPAETRIQAAATLLPYLAPRLFHIEIGLGDAEVDVVQIEAAA